MLMKCWGVLQGQKHVGLHFHNIFFHYDLSSKVVEARHYYNYNVIPHKVYVGNKDKFNSGFSKE